MSPFSLDPASRSARDRAAGPAAASDDALFDDEILMPLAEPPEWLARSVAWAMAVLTVVVAATWLWSTSVPRQFWPPVVLAFGLAAVVLSIYPAIALGEWLLARLRSAPVRLPVAASVMAVVLLSTVLATWWDLPLRVRFAANRTHLDDAVSVVTAAHDVEDPATTLNADLHVAGYGEVQVRDVRGGLWFTSAAWGAGDTDREPGFAYLPTRDAVAAWPDGQLQRDLGGDWFLATRPVSSSPS